MKILHIIPSYKPAYVYGGPIYSSSALCEQLVKTGHNVTVVTTTANGENELNVETGISVDVDGVSVLYFKRWTKDHTHFSPSLIYYLIKNIKNFEAVHIHSWWNLVSIFSLLVCFVRGVRPVISPRGMLSRYVIETNHGYQKKMIAGLFNPLLSKVKFHATAHSEYLEIRKIFPQADIKEIFNFVTIPEIEINKIKPSGSEIKMLFLSRIDPKKGIELLFEALNEIDWPFHLTIAGPYEETYLNKLKLTADNYNISKKITWAEPLYGDVKFKLLAINDLMMLTSYNENFANIVIESLAMGTPVFITDTVGLSSYVQTNELGWITSTSPVEIRADLNKMYHERDKLEIISEKAPSLIAKDFDRTVLVEKYISLYKSK